MPFEMGGYVQSVMVEGTLYVGGGHAGDDSDNNYIVMTYDISTGKWATLPPYRVGFFAMTAINNQLVLVGGYKQGGDEIIFLGVWNADEEQWTHPYPKQRIAWSLLYCSAVVYGEWLIVAGGEFVFMNVSSEVKLMNTNSKQWHAGTPIYTPTPWSSMRTAVVGDMCYFMGGDINGDPTDKVYTVSLSALTSGLTSKELGKSKSPMWKEISGLHTTCSTPLSISGSLFAVGGRDKDLKTVTAIHLYQPATGKWVKVGDLPTPRLNCTCAMITDKEMLVAGGGDGRRNNILKYTDIGSTTEVASIIFM